MNHVPADQLAGIVDRLVIAGNGGSFANDYAKQYAARALVKQIFAMTVADAEAILAEVSATVQS